MLRGKDGNDTLHGGPGADLLVGGRGRDVFDFNRSSDSTTGTSDMLLAGNGAKAFRQPGDDPGDLIDVSDIDARWGEPGNQSFRFGEKQGKGRLWVENRDGNTLVLGNTGGDGRAEFKLVIADGSVKAETYTEADFIL